MDRINSTITKLDELAKSVKTKEKTTLEKVPKLIKTVQQLEGENSALKISLQKQEQKLLKNEEEEKERAKNDQKTVN